MSVKNWFFKCLQSCARAVGVYEIREQIVETKILLGRQIANQMKSHQALPKISDAEFKVFSQFGDDGIIQYLLQQVDVPEGARRFIEFGVQDYQESNTRFLLMNDNWSGLILDGSSKNISKVVSDTHFWRYDLTAIAAFIDKDNVNELFSSNGFEGEIGILSVDIDGNDYWVWDAIDVVDPIIVICEYNSVFGDELAVTVPYDPKFQRGAAHYSNLYWGASLASLCMLAERRGYVFVGCNSAGNNAYFVRRDKLGNLRALKCSEGFVEAKFRESRHPDGGLTYLPAGKRLEEISQMPVFDVEKQLTGNISEIFGI
ncbi:hypothetical protein [Thalassospira sp. MCCC 1A03138]|uniref:hypothetical protein n=1 Tax=Thalassospira sp. MCCC 1A03138 TaxID=1470576 RepID=UPI000A1F3E71|nr:hypothetical protein [Thalassospira sp. MCCC 1A03138]OSQ31875.1 NADH dehydrogenase [Thalassospira sp. MCCC 1A03138]